MEITLKFDLTAVEKALTDLVSGMTAGYSDALDKTADVVSAGINYQFLLSGNPHPWEALAPRTIGQRLSRGQRTGIYPVAGLYTQLRVTDTLRHAAIATNESTLGSAFKKESHSVSVGVNTDELDYAARAMGLTEGNIPERNPFVLLPEDERAISEIFLEDMQQRIERL